VKIGDFWVGIGVGAFGGTSKFGDEIRGGFSKGLTNNVPVPWSEDVPRGGRAVTVEA
jgi:hypothetical protein